MSATPIFAIDYKSAEFEVIGPRPIRFRMGLNTSVAIWLDELDAHVAFIIVPSGMPATMTNARTPGDGLRWLQDMLRKTRLQWLPVKAHVSDDEGECMGGVCVFDVPFALVDEWLMWLDQDAAVQATGSGYVMLRSHPAIRSTRDVD